MTDSKAQQATRATRGTEAAGATRATKSCPERCRALHVFYNTISTEIPDEGTTHLTEGLAVESGFVYSASESDRPKEINNDILFREGETLQGEVTYTPRLISLDLKGSLNTLRQEGVLYDLQDTDEDILWKNDVTLHKADVASQNDYLKDLAESEQKETSESGELEKETDTDEKGASGTSDLHVDTLPEVFGPRFYDLDDQVAVWSDFLRLHLHPKSVGVLSQYRHAQEEGRFDVFGYGQDLYKQRETKLELEDRIHFFLEECDSLQGIHVLADLYDGFGGLTSSLVEELCDDYANKSLVIYSLSPTVFPDDTIPRECHRALNSLLSYDSLLPHSAALIPLSTASQLWRSTGPPSTFPHINYKPDLMYHSSALLAACLENMTLPYRLHNNSFLMNHVYDSLTSGRRKVLSAHSCFPLGLRANQSLADWLLQLDGTPPWQSLTAGCSSHHRASAQSVVLRGLEADRLTGSNSSSNPFSHCDRFEDLMEYYLTRTLNTHINAVHSIRSPLPTLAPFPHVFTPQISCEGTLDDRDRPPRQGVREVPLITSLQSGEDTSSHLDSLHSVCSKFNIKKFHLFLQGGLEEDSFRHSLDNLASVRQAYREGSGGDSEAEEEDDDDG